VGGGQAPTETKMGRPRPTRPPGSATYDDNCIKTRS